MRVALQIPAVLEGAGFALVDVDGHEPGGCLRRHRAPLAPSRKPRPAQTPQARGFQGGHHRLRGSLAGQAGLQQLVAPGLLISLQVRKARHFFRAHPRLRRRLDRGRRGPRHRVLVHQGHGGLFAAAHAGGRQHAHLGAQEGGQARQQIGRSRHLTGQARAHPHGQRGRGGHRAVSRFAHHVEVVIEAGHLKHLGLGQLEVFGQGRQMRRAQLTEVVVESVQGLDQFIAPPGAVGQQPGHFSARLRGDLAAFGRLPLALGAGARGAGSVNGNDGGGGRSAHRTGLR